MCIKDDYIQIKKKRICYNACGYPLYSALCFLIKSACRVCVGDLFFSELIMEAKQNNKILPTEITNYNKKNIMFRCC